MKAVLISIRPKWCEKIASGEKTIEVRKTRPKIETPFRSFIYETKNISGLRGFTILGRYRLGKVIGEFVCDKVSTCDHYTAAVNFNSLGLPYESSYPYLIFEDDYRSMCLTYGELKNYGNGKPLYAWHISNLKIYDKPKELEEFCRVLPDKDLEEGNYDCRKDWDVLCADAPEGSEYCATCIFGGRVQITRPPQSWCYVEEI